MVPENPQFAGAIPVAGWINGAVLLIAASHLIPCTIILINPVILQEEGQVESHQPCIPQQGRAPIDLMQLDNH